MNFNKDILIKKVFRKLGAEFINLKKEFVGYIEDDLTEGSYQCKDCIYWLKDNRCTGVKGIIKGIGSCNLYLKGENASSKEELPEEQKISQKTAVYLENEKGFGCKNCRFFGNNSCLFIEGTVLPNACCNLWELETTPK